KNQASATGASVSFDNLQYFDIQNNIVSDNFNGTQTDLVNNWVIIQSQGSSTVTESGGVVTCAATGPGAGNYAGCFYQGRTFQIVEGGKLEMAVDLITDSSSGGSPNGGTFPVLGYFPGGSAGASTLTEYFTAPNPATVYNGK